MNSLDQKLTEFVARGLRLFRIDVKNETVQMYVQFIKFGVVGVSNTVISYLLNILTLLLLKPYNLSWDYIAGNLVAFVLSVLWSFYWNNKFVFSVNKGQSRNVWHALLKTYLAYCFTGIVLNNIMSTIWIKKLGISKLIAPILNLIISIPINFLINKFWAFKSIPDDA
jgi:putative flippase GtrA